MIPSGAPIPICEYGGITIMTQAKAKLTTLDMVTVAFFAVLIAVCAWISIPATVPFTLQTFGVLCTLGLLGGRKATLTVLVYLLLGAIGIPVFSGFRGGVGVLVGTTGGYLLGFLCAALLYWLITALLGDKPWARIAGMLAGLVIAYVFGTAWFMAVYVRTTGPVGISTALSWCVLPFIIPEIVKTALATLMVRTIPKRVKALR
jgi:biotin transport system substrate-specific component